MDRLHKILSQWGIASRRQAEIMIRSGRVHLNGAVASLGMQADPEVDRIEVDGNLVQPQARPELLYLLLNKPLGVVSTCLDERGRTTVLDLLPPEWRSHQGLHPVGRLDADSTGALILTNDGALTFRLTHPRHEIPKTYHVWVEGIPPPEILAQWRRGVLLDDRPTLPAQVKILRSQTDHQSPKLSAKSPPMHPRNPWQPESPKTLLEIILREGKNRQIRRIAAYLGYPVISLHRIAIGTISLSHDHRSPLSTGDYRLLTTQEIKFLYGCQHLVGTD
ncbi:MAG: rRNA pseudouridine synthase [Coleofasciculaceae cyanobacterium SM2_1_6]|nr:rRNA pseudouridine synthase [Coleofasciculaceae cyanobacterium SM2_1_6]